MLHRVLLIQDDLTGAAAVYEALNGSEDWSFTVNRVSSGAEGLERLKQASDIRQGAAALIQVVIVDISRADRAGMDAFEQIFDAHPHLPILVLAAGRDEASARTVVQRGAQDYLLKERLDSYSLRKALRGMLERASITQALFEEKERAQVTLESIGDAVMSTDVSCNITFLNSVAERLTGWSQGDARGRPLLEVFRIVDGATCKPAENPLALAILENKTVALTPNCMLIRRDGLAAAIEDSTAPIHDRGGNVSGAVMVFRDVTKARAQSEHLEFLAQHDILTGLANRVLLSDRIGQAVALARRHHHKLAVLFLDIDRFKHVNDSLGHDAGDLLLQTVSHRLLQCVRKSDTVSRQGGDEFVVLLPELTSPQDAAILTDKIVLALGAPYTLGSEELRVTVSAGISIYPDDGSDAETLLKSADFAMYHAKESGRNNYQFFRAEQNDRAIEHRAVDSGLRLALERGEFVLYYQPMIHLATRLISGVEALLRWRHPKRGLISPENFLPHAEESGAIIPMGRWVLREACRQARIWQDTCLHPIPFAVNVSPVELRDPGFVAGVRAILAATGLEPQFLQLELTETVLVQDTASTAVVLQALRDLGVQLALDDFGTGFSSLSHLKRFPINTLKIDQSFVRDLTSGSGDASIVGAVLSMAESLRLQVVAEGVETFEQFELLKELGCPEAQGFFFCRPVVAEELTQLLRRGKWVPLPSDPMVSLYLGSDRALH
jgi:diguanylate cyclase (GGDEF)-like protein/PAS domain S-box-containing protein